MISTTFHANFPKLLDTLYAAALRPELTPAVLSALSTAFGGCAGVIRKLHSDLSTESYAYGNDEAFSSSFSQYYAAMNPYSGEMLAAMPVGRVMFASQLIPEEEINRTEFYNDWMKPQGASPHHCGVAYGTSLGTRSILTISPFDPAFAAHRAEYAECLSLIVPHLSRAAEIRNALSGRATNALDTFDAPTIVVSGDGKVSAASPEAESVLQAGHPIWRTPSGHLRARGSSQDARLQHAIRLAAQPVHPRPTGPVRLECKKSGQSFLSWVVPAQSAVPATRVLFAEEGHAIVVVRPISCPHDVSSEMLCSAFNISPAEARLLSALIAGQSIEEFAAARGVSRSTVKNQLAALFAKTGTKRQAELVSLALGSISAIRR
jgi:DNA-binding CsgD family transcriptional regulator